MKIGFKKSLFGFNSQEVASYIKKENENFAKIENGYKAEIDALKSQIESQNSTVQLLLSQLEEYTKKEAEINELANSIAELYVVANITAEETIKNAELSEAASQKQVDENIKAVSDANTELGSIEENLRKTVADFNVKVDTLKASLEKTKNTLQKNKETVSEFKQMYLDIK